MHSILNLIVHYGYPAIFALLMLGVFGIPIPDETLLVFSGFLASKGNLWLPLTILVAILGSACGISISYLVGRLGGFYMIRKYGPRFHITEDRLNRTRKWFDHIGKWSLIIGYYLPGIRHITAIVAGSTGMKYKQFALFAYTGALLWATTFILLGYYLGGHWQRIAERIHSHLVIASALVVIAAIAAYLCFRFFRPKKTI
jgi:membrane protein DedA with SNARE-associated domain